ncbi:Uncharacterised protein [Legionella sainthelensi]|nr:Uncharacterised protein [Legionella sainthelensi]
MNSIKKITVCLSYTIGITFVNILSVVYFLVTNEFLIGLLVFNVIKYVPFIAMHSDLTLFVTES